MSAHPAMTRAERVALEAAKAFSSSVEAGGATVLQVPGAPDSPMVNRIAGLGLGRPATEADVDRALAAIEPGVTFYVAVGSAALPPELPDWLRARGLEPGWGWMEFHRGVAEPPPAATSLRIVPVATAAHAAAFARLVRAGFELPAAVEPALAAAVDAGWSCFLALDGDEPAAAAGLYAAEGAAYLGFAATRPESRGRGAQGALLATRIRHAAELGCDLVVTETGERRTDRPSNSYRNILRAGFVEHAVTANWLGRR
jgi:GNAT superfamily N-acetyltransferase